MTVKPGALMANIINNQSGSLQVLNDAALNGKVLQFSETITYASQATTDTIPVARLPKNAVILGFLFLADTSSGSATIAIVDANPGGAVTYVTAAAFTSTDTPTWKGKSAVCNTELGQGYDYLGNKAPFMDLIVTIASAALPASGTLHITTFYGMPN